MMMMVMMMMMMMMMMMNESAPCVPCPVAVGPPYLNTAWVCILVPQMHLAVWKPPYLDVVCPLYHPSPDMHVSVVTAGLHLSTHNQVRPL